MTTLTDADIPGRNDGLAPLSTTVTGKLATPEVTVASSATSVTLPAHSFARPGRDDLGRLPHRDLVDERVADRTVTSKHPA